MMQSEQLGHNKERHGGHAETELRTQGPPTTFLKRKGVFLLASLSLAGVGLLLLEWWCESEVHSRLCVYLSSPDRRKVGTVSADSYLLRRHACGVER
jgi:hypothetical protein